MKTAHLDEKFKNGVAYKVVHEENPGAIPLVSDIESYLDKHYDASFEERDIYDIYCEAMRIVQSIMTREALSIYKEEWS